MFYKNILINLIQHIHIQNAYIYIYIYRIWIRIGWNEDKSIFELFIFGYRIFSIGLEFGFLIGKKEDPNGIRIGSDIG